MSLQNLPPRRSLVVRPVSFHWLLLFAALWVLAGVVAPRATAMDPQGADSHALLTLLERSIVQEQGSWQVDYRLRYEGAAGILVTPGEIMARVEGWVSNSRVSSHALPRWSALVISGPAALSATTEVITSADEAQRCRERALLLVWTGDSEAPAPRSMTLVGTTTGAAPSTSTGGAERPTILSVAPGATVRVRIRLEHQHFLYGDYDPLLGHRSVELHLGAATLGDPVVPMDREQYLAQPKSTWPVPPEDRRDTRHYVSPPDSLHLEAHIPGNQYYRFPERPVRYSTKMRLRFWYLIAAGTEGECRARVAQYKDTPTAWKVLTDGAHEEVLTTVGRWVKVERVFRTEPEATTLALDFRISGGAEVGEMWIDDVSLEPVVATPAQP
jgi:hypothetical protein